jgi:hypothetical protein
MDTGRFCYLVIRVMLLGVGVTGGFISFKNTVRIALFRDYLKE